jgi:hypothetical protein
MKATAAAASLFLALVVLGGAARADDAVLLRFKFTPGETRSYVLNVTGSGQMEMSGSPLGEFKIPLDMTLNGSFDLLTRAVEADGSGDLGVHMGVFGVDMTIMGQPTHMTMDLEKGKYTVDGKEMPAPGAGAGGAAPQGVDLSKLTVVLSPQGKVKDLQGLEELLAALPKGGPMMLPGGGALPNIKEMLKDYPPLLPAGPVAPGATWEQSVKLALPGLTEATPMIGKYTLEKLGQMNGHQVARIGYTTDYQLNNLTLPAPAPAAPGAAPGTPGAAPGPTGAEKINSLTVRVKGQMYFDVTGGFVHSVHLEMVMGMEMIVPPPQPPAGAAPAAGDEPATPAAPVKMAMKDVKLYYNLYPQGGESAAAGMGGNDEDTGGAKVEGGE